MDEAKKHDIQLIESGKDAAKAFQTPEDPLHFVTTLVHFSVIRPWLQAIAFWRNHGNKAKVERQWLSPTSKSAGGSMVMAISALVLRNLGSGSDR